MHPNKFLASILAAALLWSSTGITTLPAFAASDRLSEVSNGSSRSQGARVGLINSVTVDGLNVEGQQIVEPLDLEGIASTDRLTLPVLGEASSDIVVDRPIFTKPNNDRIISGKNGSSSIERDASARDTVSAMASGIASGQTTSTLNGAYFGQSAGSDAEPVLHAISGDSLGGSPSDGVRNPGGNGGSSDDGRSPKLKRSASTSAEEQPARHLKVASEATGHADAQFIGASTHLWNKSEVWGYTFFSPSAKEFVSVNVNFLGKATVANRFPARDIIPAKPIDLSPESSEKIIPVSQALAAAKKEADFDPLTVNLGRNFAGKAVYTFTAMADQRVIIDAVTGEMVGGMKKADPNRLKRLKDRLTGELLLPAVPRPFRVSGIGSDGYKVHVMVAREEDLAPAKEYVDEHFKEDLDLIEYQVVGRFVAAAKSAAVASSPVIRTARMDPHYGETATELQKKLRDRGVAAQVQLDTSWSGRAGVPPLVNGLLLTLNDLNDTAKIWDLFQGENVSKWTYHATTGGLNKDLKVSVRQAPVSLKPRFIFRFRGIRAPFPRELAELKKKVQAAGGTIVDETSWMLLVEGDEAALAPLAKGSWMMSPERHNFTLPPSDEHPTPKAVAGIRALASSLDIGVTAGIEPHVPAWFGKSVDHIDLEATRGPAMEGAFELTIVNDETGAKAVFHVPDAMSRRRLGAKTQIEFISKDGLKIGPVSIDQVKQFDPHGLAEIADNVSIPDSLTGRKLAATKAVLAEMKSTLLTDKVSLPTANLFAAAKSLKPMTGPGYAVKGKLRGTSIAGPVAGMDTATVELEIDGKTVQVQNPGAILDAVKKIRPQTVHYYEFEGTVEINAVVSEWAPPFGTSVTATLTIEHAGAKEPGKVGALPPSVEQARRKTIENYLQSKGFADFQVSSYADVPAHILSGTNVASIKTGPQHANRVGAMYEEIQKGLQSGALKVPFEIWEIVAGDRVFRDKMPRSISIVIDATKVQEILTKIKDTEIATYSQPTEVPPYAGAKSFGHVRIAELKTDELGQGGWVLHQRTSDGGTSARDYYLEWTGAVAQSMEAEVARHAQRLADHHAEIAAPTEAVAAAATVDKTAALKTIAVPHDYHEYRRPQDGAAVMRRNEKNGYSVSYRTASGLEVALDGSNYAELVRSRSLTLYKVRTKDNDGEGHTVWDTSYVLAVRGHSKLRPYQGHLDALIERGRAAWDKHQKAVDALHNVIHAARIISGRPDDAKMTKIKEEVHTALAQFSAIEEAYRQQYAQWQAEARALRSQVKDKAMRTLVSDALKASDPQSYDSFHWKDQGKWISAVLAIDAQIYDQPSVRYVDPGGNGDVRIGFDVRPIIEQGGSAEGSAEKVQQRVEALLKSKKIDAKVSVELLYENSELSNSLFDISQNIVNEILAPAIGVSAIKGFGRTGSDSDSKGWWEIRVTPATAAAARGLLPKIKAEMTRYGFRSFAKNIIIAVQKDDGTISEDEKMPSGNSAAGWTFEAKETAKKGMAVSVMPEIDFSGLPADSRSAYEKTLRTALSSASSNIELAKYLSRRFGLSSEQIGRLYLRVASAEAVSLGTITAVNHYRFSIEVYSSRITTDLIRGTFAALVKPDGPVSFEDSAAASTAASSGPTLDPTQLAEFEKLLATRPGKNDHRQGTDHSKHSVLMVGQDHKITFWIEEPPRPGTVLANVFGLGIDTMTGKTWGKRSMRNTAGGPSPRFVAMLSDEEVNRRLGAEMSGWIDAWKTPASATPADSKSSLLQSAVTRSTAGVVMRVSASAEGAIDARWAQRLARRELPKTRIVSSIAELLAGDPRHILTEEKHFFLDSAGNDSYVLEDVEGKVAQRVTFGVGWISLETTEGGEVQYLVRYEGDGTITDSGVIPVPAPAAEPQGPFGPRAMLRALAATSTQQAAGSPEEREAFQGLMRQFAELSEKETLTFHQAGLLAPELDRSYKLRLEPNRDFRDAFFVYFENPEHRFSTLVAYEGFNGYVMGDLNVTKSGDTIEYKHVFDGTYQDVFTVTMTKGKIVSLRYEKFLNRALHYSLRWDSK